MKEELKKAIDSAAMTAASKKQNLASAKQRIADNEKRIEELEAQVEAAENFRPALEEAYLKACVEGHEAMARYAFYCNEGINNPY